MRLIDADAEIRKIKEKLKHWFHMVRTNKCLGCCLICQWWDMCKWDDREEEE